MGHNVKGLPQEECPQVLIKVRHLHTHPLADGDAGSGTLLYSGLQPVLHTSVLTEPVSQLQNSLVNLPSRPTGCWPGGPPVTWWWLTGAGLGRAGQLTGRLAGDDTGSIFIVSSLILPLRIHLEHWGLHPAKLAVVCPDAQVGQQETKVHLCLLLPCSQRLSTLA